MDPSDTIHDVAIVGGGPAGATAALCCARRGLSTVVLERESHPRFHIGESLLPRNQTLLRELGLLHRLDRIPRVPKFGASFVMGDAAEPADFWFAAGPQGEESYTFSIERAPFDEMLAGAARAAGACIRERVRVKSIERLADGDVHLATTDGPVRSRVLLDASGQGTVVGRHLGTRRGLPDLKRVACFAHFTGVERRAGRLGGSPIIVMCDEGWFWSIPQLSLQLLYERRGEVTISALADHGHLLRGGERIDVPRMLKDAGFRPTNRLRGDDDVVVDQDGLVNFAGVHTSRAKDVAETLASHPEIELVIWLDGDRVMVRGARGSAAVEHRDGRYRYTVIDHDVLTLGPVSDRLAAEGKADSDGFIASRDWFDATIDHEWPDAPFRLWEAFHGLVIHTPDVMLTTAPGYYVGAPVFDRFIDMASTHGGLNQQDSATFVMTMTGRALRPMRSGEVIPTIEPEYDPSILRR